MVREQIKVDIPDEWMENMKHGRCWCGKDHNEFEDNQKFYCSKAHADDYKKRIQYWSTFKSQVLDRDNESCVKCGRNKKGFEAEQKRLEIEYYRKNAILYPKAIQMDRAIKLKELQEQYENIMNDGYIMQHINWKVTEEFGLPRISFDKEWFNVEVDHIKAVALGGEMWDIKNMQTLCTDCHKEKTKDDMKKLKILKKEEVKING